jgi:hypothetical protein
MKLRRAGNSRNMILFFIIVFFFLICFALTQATKTKETFDSGLQGIFENIYTTKHWSTDGDGSGDGSDGELAKGAIRTLVSIFNDNQIFTVVDVACGACKWVPDLLNQSTVKYIGYDVSPTAIKRARNNLRDFIPARATIEHGDLVTTKHADGDMILCRDALQHLSYSSIRKGLKNLAMANAKLFVLGSYPEESRGENQNRDDGDGGYFSIDLALPPFEMTPTHVLAETDPFQNKPQKFMYVYTKDQMMQYTTHNQFFVT